MCLCFFFFFKQKTAYEMRISDWSSDVCSSDLHRPPSVEDYELLLSRSHEAAWIATEGNAFNHATDRVADVAALAERLKAEDWPIKDRLEISRTGRVRQTALRADTEIGRAHV